MARTSTAYFPKLPSQCSNALITTPTGVLRPQFGDKRTTKAVKEQSRIVSINTSKMPRHPCPCGLPLALDAWAAGDVPQPASFDKTPRETPYLIAAVMP